MYYGVVPNYRGLDPQSAYARLSQFRADPADCENNKAQWVGYLETLEALILEEAGAEWYEKFKAVTDKEKPGWTDSVQIWHDKDWCYASTTSAAWVPIDKWFEENHKVDALGVISGRAPATTLAYIRNLNDNWGFTTKLPYTQKVDELDPKGVGEQDLREDARFQHVLIGIGLIVGVVLVGSFVVPFFESYGE
jgi:hypothetical protein